MADEIERRFLVTSMPPLKGIQGNRIVQSYLAPGAADAGVQIVVRKDAGHYWLDYTGPDGATATILLTDKLGQELEGDISDKVVRIRIVDSSQAFLTVKGKKVGARAPEAEDNIDLMDAFRLMGLSKFGSVAKHRYPIRVMEHIWEVDVFIGLKQDLVLAEIELTAEDEQFAMPTWVGQEVTTDHSYSNVALAQQSPI